MSTSSTQRRLSFPVRKSTRQRKTNGVSSLKIEEVHSSPLRRSKRNTIDREVTPEKILGRNQQTQDSPQSCGSSPGKRKSQSVPSPPTPPKSPCKFAKSCENQVGECGHVTNLPTTPTNRNDTVTTFSTPIKCEGLTESTKVIDRHSSTKHVHSLSLGHASPLRSPSNRKCENVPPLSTPPKSPFLARTETSILSSPKRHQENRLITMPQKALQDLLTAQSPRKSGADENRENFVLKSPKKPAARLLVGKPDNKPYQSTKQLLHTAKPDVLVGRDKEVSEIKGFLKTHLEKQSAGSLYISGAPGTGKTAALLHIIDDFKDEYRCKIGYLNCMTVKNSASVFRKLHTELSGKMASNGKTAKDMEKLLTTSRDSLILVLDEIDQLDSKNQEVLYTIFEWPYLPSSKLLLIGVANALDLTDRILPRLQAKPHCRPALLHFAPYTRDEITAIITNRLTQCRDSEAVIETSAVQFCARKVSAVAGDMRKALDVCRRAVELVESEIRSQQVLRVADCNSPSKSQPAVKKIGIAQISKVLSEVYGSSVQAQQSEEVPLQQKLMVCTLLLVVKSGKFKEVQLGKVYESYCKVCRRQQMAPVDQSEFHSLCVLLEARGIIGMKKAKDTRLIKLTLRQDEKELEQTLQDRVLVSTILQEGLPK